MARSLAARLDRLERLAADLLNTTRGPVYLREGEPVPEGREPVYIKRIFLDPPEHAAKELPTEPSASPAIERSSPSSFTRPLATPPLGIV